MQSLLVQRLLILALFALVILGLYVGNIAYQSGLGRIALAQMNLTSVPLDQALSQARNDSKKVLVDISAIWCPTCRLLDQQVFSNTDVQAMLKEDYVYCRMEYDSPEAQAFLKDHQATGYPNLWVLDRYGQVIKHIPFTLNPNLFMGSLPD